MACCETLVRHSMFAPTVPKRTVAHSIDDDIPLNKQDLKLILQTISDLVNLLPIASSLPNHETNALAVVNARKQIDARMLQYMGRVSTLTENFNKFIDMYGKLIAKEEAANCYENAILAHLYLAKQGIKTEVLRVVGKSSDNTDSHVFLISGRDKSIDINNLEQWADDDVTIIDPFMQELYPASKFQGNMKLCHFDQASK